MPHVITDACTLDYKCAEACQRKNIHPKKGEELNGFKQLFINPKRCLDCGTCASVCEYNAIYAIDELPEDKLQFAEINAAYYRK
jgi:ferredoxin/flavodoxin---NADP+ reductase